MQAIIMAAGKGTRLSPLSDNKPKCFVEIGGRKLLDHQIEQYERFGIEEIVIVTGYKSEMIEEHVTGKPHIRTVFNPFYESTNVLSSFWVGMSCLHDDFIYSHADTIFDIPILEKLLHAESSITLPVDVKQCGEEEMKVKTDENGSIIEINKTMDGKEALGEFIGVARINKNVLSDLKNIVINRMKSKDFGAFFEVALQDLINSGNHELKMIDITGEYWNEIDFISDYEAACDLFQSSQIYRHMVL